MADICYSVIALVHTICIDCRFVVVRKNVFPKMCMKYRLARLLYSYGILKMFPFLLRKIIIKIMVHKNGVRFCVSVRENLSARENIELKQLSLLREQYYSAQHCINQKTN